MTMGIMPGPGLIAASGGGGAAYWDPSRIYSPFTLSNSNKTLALQHGSYSSGQGITSRSSGKYYFEIHIDTVGGDQIVGIGTSSIVLSTYLGSNTSGYGYISDGRFLNNGVYATGEPTFTTGDVIGVAADMTALKIWFSKNGTWIAGGNPAAGTGAAMPLTSGTYFPSGSGYGGATIATLRVMNSEFLTAPPAGFTSWSGL